jgi:hypothetical protein
MEMSNNDHARQRRSRSGRFVSDRSASGRALSAARLRLITAHADKAEDELRRMRASVITREDADATWAAMKAAIRGRLLLVPGQAIDGSWPQPRRPRSRMS